MSELIDLVRLTSDITDIGYVIVSQTATHIRGAGAIERRTALPLLKQPIFDAVLCGDRWDLEILPRRSQLQVRHSQLTEDNLLTILKEEFKD